MQGCARCVLFELFESEDEKLPGTKWKFAGQTREAQDSANIPPKGRGRLRIFMSWLKPRPTKNSITEGSPPAQRNTIKDRRGGGRRLISRRLQSGERSPGLRPVFGWEPPHP
jgi:hypothetical protein